MQGLAKFESVMVKALRVVIFTLGFSTFVTFLLFLWINFLFALFSLKAKRTKKCKRTKGECKITLVCGFSKEVDKEKVPHKIIKGLIKTSLVYFNNSLTGWDYNRSEFNLL